MKQFEQWAERVMMPFADKLNRNKIIIALRDGMILSLPFILFGSFCLIIANFPYLDRILPNVVEPLQTFFNHASTVTIGMMALPVLVGVASSFGREYKVDRIYSVMVAFISYLMLSNFSKEVAIDVADPKSKTILVEGIIPTNIFGSEAIFTAIIISMLSVYLYQFLVKKNITIKMPDSVPPNVAASFSSLIPVCVVLLLALVLKNLFLLTPFGTFQTMIYQLITAPLLKFGNNIFTLIFLTIIQQLLWVFGIHGTNIIGAILDPIQNTMMAANTEALQAGLELPYILSKPFVVAYAQAGAQGILPAVIAAVIVCKSKQAKTINKLSLPVAIFNIQEPFHFGFPTFMNPILMIPYIFCTVIQIILAYTLCVIQIAPIPINLVPWTTPIILSGFLSTGSIMGSVVQILQLALGILIWLPFLKIQDKAYVQAEREETVHEAATHSL